MRTQNVCGIAVGVVIADDLYEAIVIKVDEKMARECGIPTLIVRGSEGQVNYSLRQLEFEYAKTCVGVREGT